ncbi:hypothetical protein CL654_00065 [bacterium]|nr:hypothetical protein [bacterium]|tara:strand:+ start:9084 stop:9743 length:660 start_codon:yes stop_codon:yes gene_type:complete
MNKSITITYWLGGFVSCAGLLVMVGWFFDIDILKSIVPGFVTMKFTTALSFFVSGILLWSLAHFIARESDIAQFLIATGIIIVFLVMSTLLFSYLLDFRTGLEDLFVQEEVITEETVAPGLPSLGTMVAFILVVVPSTSIFLARNDAANIIYSINGILIIVLGAIALLGYAIKTPALYYFIPGVSTGMAIHTALLFVLLGIGYLYLGNAVKHANDLYAH